MKDRVTEYAENVIKGNVEHRVGKLHIRACERHLNDLEKQKEFYWDADASEKILKYAETLTIAEGSKPTQLRLIGPQMFDIGCTFGWKKKSNNKRRFRRRYKSIARQNGKTMENGLLSGYVAGFCGYHYGKLFTVATKKRQSRLAWEELAKFIKADKDLSELYVIKDYKSYIECKLTNCTIEALSREGGLDDGFRSIFASIDELHQHKDNKIYKAIYNGTRSLPETLISMITTRGDNLNSFCKEMDDYCIKILEGTSTAEDFFVDIYSLDEEDDIWEEENWAKANPFIATRAEFMENLRTDAETARDMQGSDLRDFLTKCLNMWVQNTNNIFMPADVWNECGTELSLEDFRGCECVAGLDLSSGGDLTTICLEFERPEFYFIHSHSFMPRGRLEEHIETDIAPYDLWENKELLTVTGGAEDYKNDYKFIIKYFKDLINEYGIKVKAIGIDPHNADGILSDLEEITENVIIVNQSAKSLNDATEDIQLLAKSKKIRYNRHNELLTWSVLNAAIVENSFSEKKVDKKNGEKYRRIDPVDAMIDAHTVTIKDRSIEKINTEQAMNDYLSMMGWK